MVPTPSTRLHGTRQGYDRWVSVGPVRLHYVEMEPTGKAMILLHGIGMDYRVWQAVSRRLREHFHLFLIDLRGHGKSDKPEHGYSLAHYAADIEDMIDGLGMANAVVVGSSLGGAVAAAIEAPTDIVSHRILVDPPLTGGPIRDGASFQEILRLKHEPVSALAEFLADRYPEASNQLLSAMAEMWHEAADGVIQDMLADPLHYFDVSRALELNEAPTLLLQADRRAALTDEYARKALETLPDGKSLRIDGSSHAIHGTHPREFVAAVCDFLGIEALRAETVAHGL